jgi:hypothetical protein
VSTHMAFVLPVSPVHKPAVEFGLSEVAMFRLH